MTKNVGLGLIPSLALFILVVLMPVSVRGDSGVTITGVHLTNNIAVDQRVGVEVHLETKVALLSVVLSYTSQAGKAANVTMALVLGSATNGWWNATIEPSLLQQTSRGITTYSFSPMVLLVEGSFGWAKIPFAPEFLPAWSVQTQENQSTVVLDQTLSSNRAVLLGLGVLGFLVGGLFPIRTEKSQKT